MYSNSRLVRRGDEKEFRVTNLAHWSDIESLDGHEKDYVKWYGNDGDGTELMVSSIRGFTYRVKKDEE